MTDIDKISKGLTEAMRAHLMAAYQAGFRDGEAQAAHDLRLRVAKMLGETPRPVTHHLEAKGVESRSEVGQPDMRVSPGTVKPAILKLVQETPGGLSQEMIESLTGFKHNSVRGTLWNLANEGMIRRNDDGRYVAVKENEPPKGGSETDEASTSSIFG